MYRQIVTLHSSVRWIVRSNSYCNHRCIKVVTGLTINYEGWGYTSVPIMTIEQPTLGSQATAVAIMTSRSGVPNQSIDRILITIQAQDIQNHQ